MYTIHCVAKIVAASPASYLQDVQGRTAGPVPVSQRSGAKHGTNAAVFPAPKTVAGKKVDRKIPKKKSAT